MFIVIDCLSAAIEHSLNAIRLSRTLGDEGLDVVVNQIHLELVNHRGGPGSVSPVLTLPLPLG